MTMGPEFVELSPRIAIMGFTGQLIVDGKVIRKVTDLDAVPVLELAKLVTHFQVPIEQVHAIFKLERR